jgi:hypothetical protein
MGWLKNKIKKIAKAAKKLAKKVVQTVKKVLRVAQEVAWRAASIFDFAGSLLGIQLQKHARLKVFVLYDETDPTKTTVVSSATAEQWVEVAKDVFKQRLNITLHTHKGEKGAFVHVLAAPSFVMTGPPCGFTAGFKDRADWFEEHTTDTLLGYGGTMYAFIVKTLDEKSKTDLNGCSWPWIHNFCLIDAIMPRSTTVPHEMGHLCGVFVHSDAPHNLMNTERDDMDSKLKNWQKAIIRTARYVTYGNVNL